MSRISTSTPTLDRMTRMVSEDQSPQKRRNGISRNPSDASLISKESISSLRSQRFELVFTIYRKVASSNPSRLKAHAGFLRLLMKGIFDPYVLRPFDKKLIS